MSALRFLSPKPLYIEIGHSSIKMLDGDDGLELSLDRQENGRLTPVCAERLASSVKVFLKRHSLAASPRAYCALGGRGVSLRRLDLPATTKEELGRLVELQLEREFPAPPSELAWGWRELGQKQSAGKSIQQVLVAAVKREAVQEYSEVLAKCGVSPAFTFGAFARNSLLGHTTGGDYAILDIGKRHSELVTCENGMPAGIRVLPWGGENLTSSIQQQIGGSHADAEKAKLQKDRTAAAESAFARELEALAGLIRQHWKGGKLFVCGETARLNEFPQRLSRNLPGVECELIRTAAGEGRSAAILGLKQSCETNGSAPPLVLQARAGAERELANRPVQWKWAALAVVLLVAAISMRYMEPLLFKGRVAQRIAEMKAYREKLPRVEREFLFLQYLKTNQPPYLDPLALVANAAPQGTKIDTLALTRRGDLSLRATMRDFQQAVDFRSKIIGSGYFSNVVVEEQTPSPDRQKMTVRITGQWTPGVESRSVDGVLKATEKPKPGNRPSPPATAPAPTARSSKTGAAPAPLPPEPQE